jgi:neutral ceramidase
MVLKVGIAEVDITPAPGLPRAGMPNPQKGQGTAWSLMGRVFIFDDGTQQAAIITLDLLMLTVQTVAEFRQAITQGTGVQPENVMITCTHTHWAPHTAAIMDEDADFGYLDFVCARLGEGMRRAWENRQPARLQVGRIEAPGWAFNRRPIYQTAHGEQVGTQGPQWIPEFVGMEGPDDPELQVLLIETPSSQVRGGLVNFTCHATVGPDGPQYSADYPGPLCEALATYFGGGTVFGFLQGCAGNIWQMNMSQPREQIYQENGTEYTRKMGEALAAKVIEARKDKCKVNVQQIQVARKMLTIPQRKPTPEQVALAKWFLEKRPADLDLQKYHFQMYGHDFTFYSNWGERSNPAIQGGLMWQEDWFARGIIGLWEFQRRSGLREWIEDVEVQVISLGEVAFVGYPAEYFVEYGLQTKARSPFATTFVSELTNGWHGYVPTLEAFQHGGYETRLGDASHLIEDAGERMCEAGIELLSKLKK